ncbi:hypothetical protein HMPREF9440_02211 [Sutterella parvirubra YIT 11816]|uniref:Uncharacterized protein n=1 Tax=Sutterella parvirubra YIT 11816 TaxID=762967 RepID=H3KHG7_9BURK|nr:hypothetical protein HMPREF9440_02211 [Sutterella parvirubra YIT 11816]
MRGMFHVEHRQLRAQTGRETLPRGGSEKPFQTAVRELNNGLVEQLSHSRCSTGNIVSSAPRRSGKP